MKRTRLTPFSGSLFRLALTMVGAVGILALLFVAAQGSGFGPGLRHSTESFDTRSESSSDRSQVDWVFVQRAAELNAAGIKLSEVAALETSNETTRTFAQQVLADYRLAGGELNALATRAGFTNVDDRGPVPRFEKTGLRAPAKDIDAGYLKQIADLHADEVDLFEKAATQCNDPVLLAYAARTLLTLNAQDAQATHLRNAQK